MRCDEAPAGLEAQRAWDGTDRAPKSARVGGRLQRLATGPCAIRVEADMGRSEQGVRDIIDG